MTQSQAEPVRLARADAKVPQALELRHLRYLVAVAEAGTFTRAAEQVFIAQPTLSQQIVDLMGESADGDTEGLLAELEGLSDEEVARLLEAVPAP